MLEQTTKTIEDDFLEEMLPDEEIGAEIVLEDPAQADYQIQKIARLRKKQGEITAFVQGQIKTLQEYLGRKLASLEMEISWRSQPLERYVREVYRRSEGKTKSLDLPHGKLKLRAQQDQYLCDEPMVLQWADSHPEEAQNFVLIKRIIAMNDLKKFIKDTAEIPDGVTIEPVGEPKFYLELKNEEKGGEQNAG